MEPILGGQDLQNIRKRIGSGMTYLTTDELRRLLTVAYNRNRMHHLAMLATFIHGFRVSELIALTDADVANETIACKRCKHSVQDRQPILKHRDPIWDETPLLTMKGRFFPISAGRMWQVIQRCGQLAGISRDKLHPHSLRHSTAMNIWEETKNLGLVQLRMGHKSASSTLVYLRESDRMKSDSAMAAVMGRL